MASRGATPEQDCEPGRRERRRRAMIDAARMLFLERGMEAVSLADIVRVSGGSLSTLYELFESKQGLLAAVVREHRGAGMAHFDAIVASDATPAAKLRAIADALHNEYMHPTTTGLIRLVMAESLRNPEFARHVFETIHMPFVHRLTALFTSWRDEGRAHIPDPSVTAELFLGLVVQVAQTGKFFAPPSSLHAAETERAIREAAALFVAGYEIED